MSTVASNHASVLFLLQNSSLNQHSNFLFSRQIKFSLNFSAVYNSIMYLISVMTFLFLVSRATMAEPKTHKEYDVFWKHRQDLLDAMLNPVVTASQLFGEKFISVHTRDKVTQEVDRKGTLAGATMLVDAVCSLLKVHPVNETLQSKFLKILKLFQEDTPLDIIAKEIEKEYNVGKRLSSF